MSNKRSRKTISNNSPAAISSTYCLALHSTSVISSLYCELCYSFLATSTDFASASRVVSLAPPDSNASADYPVNDPIHSTIFAPLICVIIRKNCH